MAPSAMLQTALHLRHWQPCGPAAAHSGAVAERCDLERKIYAGPLSPEHEAWSLPPPRQIFGQP
jgi:hypothetical protein